MMISVKAELFVLAGLFASTLAQSLLQDFSYGSPYLLDPLVQSTAYVPALAHYQTHIRHGPTFRQIRATRPDWFDPTIPAFQTTLYAPAVHHAAHFGALDGLARSFRQDIPLTNAAVAPALGIHPAVQNALAYSGGVVRAPAVVGLGALGYEQHIVPSSISTRSLDLLGPAAFYGHSYGGTALYNAWKKA